MLEFIKGDLLKIQTEYIAHGVAEGNQEGLGTGLALKISSKWPEIQTCFKKYARSGKFNGGSIWVSSLNNSGPRVIYLATQPDCNFMIIEEFELI
ncbi:MAG: hypothetical protein CVV64_17125 [Candidatus Wallbacteria bacterium HGW-Wallbacteria-1]|jgi:O-acetyl-ADP-ribose deacetylase (regulator of RNase III)|uniref:Uncharacterized protein n=1 Tax=Candidatus Wallbacteria bacterium HGW-Wallbacteria-1 TaxID=2013854 RepID=A0A2N1PKF9_9BACT|nr:MAG: hypothetical protein CVV64_17125 [Candidatus Wallbacteria bacterium HGW-Wallbacteria-1]